MSEEEKKAKKPAAKKAAGEAKKPAAKKAAAKEAPPKPAPEPEEMVTEEAAAGAGEPEMTPEELQKLLEEQMEKITVREIVERLMMDMASLAYQKMGLPEQVNLKYRDFDQARMAIDALKGLLGALEGKVPDSEASPFRATLANLQMNFVRLSNPGG